MPSHLCPVPALGLDFPKHTVGLEWWGRLSKDGQLQSDYEVRDWLLLLRCEEALTPA